MIIKALLWWWWSKWLLVLCVNLFYDLKGNVFIAFNKRREWWWGSEYKVWRREKKEKAFILTSFIRGTRILFLPFVEEVSTRLSLSRPRFVNKTTWNREEKEGISYPAVFEEESLSEKKETNDRKNTRIMSLANQRLQRRQQSLCMDLIWLSLSCIEFAVRFYLSCELFILLCSLRLLLI